ncbi:EscJ/YscJ/HrcJ family type III secretion inner membrane ring protein, partial [Klebsiella variicola]|nr:EscJ/YscJ/HrcJ family type III secretion inner membrane ring protein [Klebsiella variicola]
MVASSIPGMASAIENTQKLTVVFVPATAYQEQQQLTYLGPFLVPEKDLGFWRTSIMAPMIAIVLAGTSWLFWRRRITT